MKETASPISGVLVSTATGGQTFTDALGQFQLDVILGDQLTIQDARFETVRVFIKTKDDILVQVEDGDFDKI